MQAALAHDATPMCIHFNRTHDADSEQEAGLDPLDPQPIVDIAQPAPA